MEQQTQKRDLAPLAIVAALVIVAGALIFGDAKTDSTTLTGEAVTLPIRWGDLGEQLIETGVIDKDKFGESEFLTDIGDAPVVMTEENSRGMLNMLWALGLANKNEILEQGEMMDPEYGGAGNFASTGGWTLARGMAMDHYSMHRFVTLTPAQQELIDRVSKNIYRPCCGNSTHFPDCNHGMAMLGLLELMAARGVTEPEMYQIALKVNTLWFPDTYQTINQYLVERGQSLATADPKEILGAKYSSGQGYAQIKSVVKGVRGSSGSSCST